ncbi:MAG: tripartite tricarboxylate transporter substrate binding protein [Betaproteobacteria bacterium]
MRGGLAALALTATLALAQPFPNQPVKWIVPYPPGGGTDVVARSVGTALAASLGQPVVIENRPGAATLIGAEAIARAKPDGYTIGTADSGTLAFNPTLYAKLPYDPAKDFVFIGGLARFPLVLAVKPSLPVNTLAEMIDYAGKNANALNYGTPGAGSPHHLAMELFKQRARVSLTHVPYKGMAPAVQDILGGQIDVMFVDLATGLQHIRAGKLRAIAVASPKRLATLPDVPTIAESGLPDFEAYAWQAVVAPAGTPPEIVARLNRELTTALNSAEIRKKLSDMGVEPTPMPSAQIADFAKSEALRWGGVINAAGIKLEQ